MRTLVCVHVCMSIQDEPGSSQARRLFRRRVVFELTEEQIPLLEAAEARHGSKRQALVAALEAAGRVEELERAAAKAERELAKASQQTEREQAKTGKQDAKLRRELETLRKELERREADLARQEQALAAKTGESQQARAAHDEERQELEDAIDARDEQITELAERAVDALYCARCDKWAAPEHWAWQPTKSGGTYAYHRPCGDHGPGILGPASWLAHRR
jgi:hypothetical protein